MPEFDFFVGGIEDGIIQALKTSYGVPGGYVKAVSSYGGEIDAAALQAFIAQYAPQFPLMLVSYGQGLDKQIPVLSPAFNEPRIWQHECTFGVICCSSDARSEQIRRRGIAGSVGVYKMLGDVRRALAGLRLATTDTPPVMLTFEPLMLQGTEWLVRQPELTAYVQNVKTYFKWTEPDRSVATHAVTEFDFSVVSNNDAKEPGRLPGVIIE
jgi:phage gp37-like protein